MSLRIDFWVDDGIMDKIPVDASIRAGGIKQYAFDMMKAFEEQNDDGLSHWVYIMDGDEFIAEYVYGPGERLGYGSTGPSDMDVSPSGSRPGTGGRGVQWTADIHTINRHRASIGGDPIDASGWSEEEIHDMAKNIRTTGRDVNPGRGELKRRLMS